MTQTTFFRLLKTPIDAKGEALAAQIAVLHAGGQAEETFILDPAEFALIPGSPFAYWISGSIRELYVQLPPVESEGRAARIGDHPGNKDRYVRIFWEVPFSRRSEDREWVPYQKGGVYSPYYADMELVVDWDFGRETYYDFYGRPGRSSERPSNYQFFFRPGLTWPLRTTSPLSVRLLPAGCAISNKGPTVYASSDNLGELITLLPIMNSTTFKALVRLQLGAAAAAARSYEVGVIQRTPVPADLEKGQESLVVLARKAHGLQRDRDRTDETTHAFCLPGLVQRRDGSLLETSLALDAEVQAAQARLAEIQAEIDNLVFDLYGLSEADRALVRAEMGVSHGRGERAEDTEELSENLGDLCASVAEEPADEDEEEEAASPPDAGQRVQDLLMWCVGVAFGRWDVRMALDPTLLPALQGPFDPLPRCAPGALVGSDGLPPATAADIAPESWLRARRDISHRDTEGTEKPGEDLRDLCASVASSYPLPVAWDGILVDDPTHPSDIVTRVRGVLALLWGDRAGAIEREACQVLGFKTLRDYFRDPRKGFFPFHIKRYSKSRRKAPIYWLLQSERRNYGIWLYYHRLDRATLYAAGRDYADAKVALEQARLEELRQVLEALSGSARKRREGEIEQQQKLVAEVTDFRKRLDAVALLNLPPDLNDGVVISIAPLWELVPWKETQKTWEKLVAGEYPWSTMAKQMRERGLVKREP
jgi:hypothetical protein